MASRRGGAGAAAASARAAGPSATTSSSSSSSSSSSALIPTAPHLFPADPDALLQRGFAPVHGVAVLTRPVGAGAPSARALLRSIVVEEEAVLAQHVRPHRLGRFLPDRYAAQRGMEKKRRAARDEVAEAAVADADRAGRAAAANAAASSSSSSSSSSSLAPEEAYADAYRRRLREYGTIGEDSALEGYLGRPLRGMTTGALAVGAEAEGGVLLPPRRGGGGGEQWRSLLPAEGGGTGLGSMDPRAVNIAREELKRPAVPDRAFLPPGGGGGGMGGPGAVARDVALAASFDDAAAQEERLLRPVWRVGRR
jgi:hypothetical protein